MGTFFYFIEFKKKRKGSKVEYEQKNKKIDSPELIFSKIQVK